jgi:antitoxin (DNA-binding transcriptional repressor) of toxin-antitoxin stability system
VRQLSLNPVLFCEVNKERKLFMSKKTIDLNQVQLTLQELLALIKVDTEIIITEGNKPVARLIPWGDTEKTTSETPSPKLRQPGLHAGKIRTSEDFDEPLPEEFWTGES